MAFQTEAERIKQRAEYYKAKYSGAKCGLCKREITERQLKYSIREYDKPLCFSCQRFDRPKRLIETDKQKAKVQASWEKGKRWR